MNLYETELDRYRTMYNTAIEAWADEIAIRQKSEAWKDAAIALLTECAKGPHGIIFSAVLQEINNRAGEASGVIKEKP